MDKVSKIRTYARHYGNFEIFWRYHEFKNKGQKNKFLSDDDVFALKVKEALEKIKVK